MLFLKNPILIIGAVVIGILFFKVLALRASYGRQILELKTEIIDNFRQNQKMYYLYTNGIKIGDFGAKIGSPTFLKDSFYKIAVNKLIFRFTERDCEDCIASQLEYLNKKYADSLSGKILLLVTFTQPNSLSVFKGRHPVRFPIMNVPEGFIKGNIESFNIPYLFTLGENKNPCSFFFPDTQYPELYEEYYRNILH
jgi:hypothetical protein